jgi:hypothetical protein
VTHLLVQYSYLQVLDFLTTLAFLLYGIQEANPVVRLCLGLSNSPLAGLLLVKVLALALGIMVWRMGRTRLLARINTMFALVVAWNLVALIVGALHLA